MAVALVGLAAYAGATAAGYAAYAGIAATVAQGLAQMAFAKKTKINQEGARLPDLKMATSSLGVGIPWYYGTMRGAGNMIYGPPFTEIINTQTESSGKGGGGTETTTTTYTYTCNCAFLLGKGVIKGVKRIWAEGELVYDLDMKNEGYVGDLQSKIKVYLGTEDQMPDPTIESTEGVGNVEAYRGYAYIVFTSMLLTSFGNRVPNLTFEVIRSDDEVEFVNTFVYDIDMQDTKWAGAGQYINKYNPVNKSVVLRVDGSNNRGLVKYNPFLNQVEASYYLPTDKNSNFGTYGGVKNFDFTYDGDILQGGVDDSIDCVYVIDGDSMVPKRKYFKGAFGFEDTETMHAPTKILWNNKHLEYMGLHFLSSGPGHRGSIQITVQDYDTRPMFRQYVGFNKGSNLNYYYHRNISIDVLQNANMGLAWDIDPQEGYIYYCTYQSYQDNPYPGADEKRHLSISRIDPKFQYKNEEEVFILINDIKTNPMNVFYAFFDQTSRSFHIVYSGIDDNNPSSNNLSYRFLKFNVDKDTIVFDVMLSSLNGPVKDQDGNDFNIIGLGALTHNLWTRKLYIQTNTYTQKVDIDLGTQEIYNQTFSKPMEPNYRTNLSFVPDLSTLISCGYQNNTGPQIIKNVGKRFGKGTYNLADVVTDLATASGLTINDIDVSSLTNDVVNGYVIANTTTIRGCLEQLAMAYNFDVVETDWKLKFVKAGKPAVASIDYKDISAGAWSSNMTFNGLTTTETGTLELPGLVNLTYLDVGNDYQQNTQDCARYTVETKQISDNDLPMALSANEAKNIATRLMWNTWIQKYNYTFETNYDYINLEPCDVIELNTENATFTMKIVKIDTDSGIMKITATSVDSAVFEQNEEGGNTNVGNQTIKTLSPTKTYFMDIPIVQDTDNNPGYYIAVCPNSIDMKWGGSSLYSSNDGSNYLSIQSFYSKAVAGSTLTKLNDFKDGVIVDYNSTVDIILLNGELNNCTFEQMLSGKNVALIGDELISFQNAELIANKTYRLSMLLRGRYNTDDEISKHISGDSFILLNDQTVRRINTDTSYLNVLKFYKNVTFGKTVNETSVNKFMNRGKGLLCYPVNDIQSNRLANGDINITWKPNIRGNAFLADYEAIDPDGDFYEVDIISDMPNSTFAKRTIIVNNARSCTYTSAMQIADFGTVKSSVKIIIYKKNAIIGRGKPKAGIA